jgi:hypothetical protein
MRLDLLVKRENFAKIFEQSFSRYLTDVFRVTHDVSWKYNSLCSHSLLINYKLNVIYSKNIDRTKLKSIMSEYAYHSNLVRYFLQKTYISLSSCIYFEWIFTKNRVEVMPWISELDNLCIIPGNHSIRIIDLQASSCRVILKDGFNAQFINNEIHLREKYRFLPIPKLLNVDLSGLWYEEEQVSALPFNRINNKNIKAKVLLEACSSLLNLYDATVEEVDTHDYLKSLNEPCCDLVDRLPSVYNKEERDRIKSVLDWLTSNTNAPSVCNIELVQSHGDFQPANILIDNIDQQLYLIDWEYTAKRSVYYDALVFATKCRSPQGLSKRIKLVLNETDVSWNWCIKNTSTKLSKLELTIFLVEDLIVRLSELQIPNMVNKNEGLDTWIREVEKMDWLPNE